MWPQFTVRNVSERLAVNGSKCPWIDFFVIGNGQGLPGAADKPPQFDVAPALSLLYKAKEAEDPHDLLPGQSPMSWHLQPVQVRN